MCIRDRVYLPELKFCGDNGAMIAAQGYYQYIAGHTAGLELNGLPTLPKMCIRDRSPAVARMASCTSLSAMGSDCAAAKRGEYGMLPHDILPELGALFAENQR